MLRIAVRTPSRSYPVFLGSGLLARAGDHLGSLLRARKVFVITVPPVRRRWGKALLQSLDQAGVHGVALEMPDGERFKRFATLEKLAEQLVRLGADRNSTLIALGGGVTCDVTGFLASVYMRGVDVIQIPTTVLAQVDATIGGKTGVNLRSGKNLLGTFHQPLAVLIDPNVLTTLPSREYRAGLYEALKSGVIGNPGLFRLFEEQRREILDRDPFMIEKVIAESVRLKARVVSADEREGGLRQVLNFGHTIGHALEVETGYTRLLHGEAVAWGMIAATHIATATGRLDGSTRERITTAILGFGKLPGMKVKTSGIMKRLRSDKKTKHGVVHFVLPTKIGKVEIVADVPPAAVRAAIDEMRRLAAE
ncbi:MAG TPA: 3-dehydroquinate synthase [Terriglobales bacterium]|jgi:3-dehydroquinate synthase|nr:3-dehydroquinate synthase [Terriglobales bacterium]